MCDGDAILLGIAVFGAVSYAALGTCWWVKHLLRKGFNPNNPKQLDRNHWE